MQQAGHSVHEQRRKRRKQLARDNCSKQSGIDIFYASLCAFIISMLHYLQVASFRRASSHSHRGLLVRKVPEPLFALCRPQTNAASG